MMNLTILIDDEPYIQSDPYQVQLHNSFRKNHNCQYVNLETIGETKPAYENVYIATRFRNTIRQKKTIVNWLSGRRCLVQDYDPWVFMDQTSQHYMGYKIASEAIPNSSFLIPNYFWSNFISEKLNIKTHSFRLGMSPELCDDSPFENRKIPIEFRGSSNPAREKNFKEFQSRVPAAKWERSKITPYSEFLKHLSNVRVWAHDESECVTFQDESISRNCLWPKAIEVISRGCFLLRDWQVEADNYGISTLPTVFLYKNMNEAQDLLDKINRMSIEESNNRISQSVEWVKKQDFYEKISGSLEKWLSEPTQRVLK